MSARRQDGVMRGISTDTARMHRNGLVHSAALSWRTAYDPATTAVADAVESTGAVPDLELRCERGHVLVQAWVMPDRCVVLRLRLEGVSPGWNRELTTFFDPGSARLATAAAVARERRAPGGLVSVGSDLDDGRPSPRSVGLVWDVGQQFAADRRVAFMAASCRCAQRWPFWFFDATLRELLDDATRPRVIHLPIPEPCDDCEECRADRRHAEALRRDGMDGNSAYT